MAHSTISIENTNLQVEKVVSKVVSASEGGTLTVTEDESLLLAGLKLKIPPDALTRNQRISIGKVIGGDTPNLPDGHAPLGYQFVLQPSGLEFKRPVVIRFDTSNNTRIYNDFRLMKYDESTHKWVPHTTTLKSEVLIAQVNGFSLWEWVRFWKPRNPASEANILKQARQWRPSLNDSKLRKLLQKELGTGATYKDAIGALLLNESMWRKIRDGKFYDSVSLAKVASKTLAQEVLEDFAKKVAGLPTLGLTVQMTSFIIEVSLKAFFKEIGISLGNAQLSAYLSWRGWFFENGSWRFQSDLAHDHATVVNGSIPEIHLRNGWLFFKQQPGGTALEKVVARRAWDKNPDKLYKVGRMLNELLKDVILENGLAKDRKKLRQKFRQLRQSEYTLTINGSGPGNGKIISHNINCILEAGATSGDCSESFNEKSTITLTAKSDTNSSFDGWSGGCSGNDAELTIVIDSEKSCTATFAIENHTPKADIAEPDDGSSFNVGETISFDGSNSSDPDGNITQWHWNFGDGESATGSTTTHSYDSSGAYTVELTVEDNDGATANDSVTVNVETGPITLTHPWRMFQQNKSNNGQGNSTGPTTPEMAKLLDIGEPTSRRARSQQITVSASGTIYVVKASTFGEHPGKLYAVSPTGEFKWASPTLLNSDGWLSTPAIGQDGTIYVGTSKGTMYALHPKDGSIEWQVACNPDRNVYLDITLADNGTLYFPCGSQVIAVSPNGVEQWRQQDVPPISNPLAIGPDGTIYAVYSGFRSLTERDFGELIAIDPTTGNIKWKNTLAINMGAPVVASDGTIYISQTRDGSQVFAVTPAGEKRLFGEDTLTDYELDWVLISPNDTVITAGEHETTNNLSVFAFNKQEEVVWRWDAQSNTAHVTGAVTGVNGTLYLSSQLSEETRVSAIDNGTKLWSIDISGDIIHAPPHPSMGTNGQLYLPLSGHSGDKRQLKLISVEE